MFSDLDYMAYRLACDYWEKRALSDADREYAIKQGKLYFARLLEIAPKQGGYALFRTN